ncbi:MAG: hypothetical protein ACI9XZ_000905, partial [Alphaproteobacteria bacterium]
MLIYWADAGICRQFSGSALISLEPTFQRHGALVQSFGKHLLQVVP